MTAVDPGRLVAFLVAAAAIVAIPGPNHVYLLTRTLTQGRRAGLASAAGIETGTLLHTAAATLGLAALLAATPAALTVVRLAGAAYLVYLAIRAVRARPAPGPADTPPPQPAHRTYLDAILVNLLNPKVALFVLAFLPQFVTPGAGAATTRFQMAGYGLTLALIGLVTDVSYVLLANVVRRRMRRRSRPSPWGRYVTAALYLGLAGLALAS